jgi:hypothetical protein
VVVVAVSVMLGVVVGVMALIVMIVVGTMLELVLVVTLLVMRLLLHCRQAAAVVRVRVGPLLARGEGQRLA